MKQTDARAFLPHEAARFLASREQIQRPPLLTRRSRNWARAAPIDAEVSRPSARGVAAAQSHRARRRRVGEVPTLPTPRCRVGSATRSRARSKPARLGRRGARGWRVRRAARRAFRDWRRRRGRGSHRCRDVRVRSTGRFLRGHDPAHDGGSRGVRHDPSSATPSTRAAHLQQHAPERRERVSRVQQLGARRAQRRGQAGADSAGGGDADSDGHQRIAGRDFVRGPTAAFAVPRAGVDRPRGERQPRSRPPATRASPTPPFARDARHELRRPITTAARAGGDAEFDPDVAAAREAAEDDAAAASASFRFLSSCSLNFKEPAPDGFYAPWGFEFPESELSGEYRMPPLRLLERIEPDASDQRDVMLLDARRDDDLRLFCDRVVRTALETYGDAETSDDSVAARASYVAMEVAQRLGGAMESDECCAAVWAETSYDLSSALNTLVFPAGRVAFQNAKTPPVLFKYVADRCGGSLPSRLVRGRYYCGSENAAANVVVVKAPSASWTSCARQARSTPPTTRYADMHRPHVPSALRVSGPLEEAETEPPPERKPGKNRKGLYVKRPRRAHKDIFLSRRRMRAKKDAARCEQRAAAEADEFTTNAERKRRERERGGGSGGSGREPERRRAAARHVRAPGNERDERVCRDAPPPRRAFRRGRDRGWR